jgi:uncharacterized protein YceK
MGFIINLSSIKLTKGFVYRNIYYMKRFLIRLFFIVVLSASGCVSVVPRAAVYKNDTLNAVYLKNDKLAWELSRIPGANTPNSPYSEAMKALFFDYRGKNYSEAFEEILGTGNKEERPYAPGLEALLWIYQRNPDTVREVLRDFSIEKLISTSWGDCKGPRWDDWKEIRPRLSAPEYSVYFTRNALKYIPERADGKNYLQSPFETLLIGGGDCEDFAVLIVEALEFGGYYARLFTVDIADYEKGTLNSHTVACYRDGGSWHFIQGFDGKYLSGGITGPFDQSYNMAEYIAGSIGGVPRYYYIDTILEFLEAYDHLNRGRP